MIEVPIADNIVVHQDDAGRFYLRNRLDETVSTRTWDTIALAEEAYGTGLVEWDAEAPDEIVVAVCIGCGCDDLHACEGADGIPCHWERLDRSLGIGVCSECADLVTRWDNGERSLRVPSR